MTPRIAHFSGTAAEWAASGRVLALGEMGLWTGEHGVTVGIKFGDGATAADELPWFSTSTPAEPPDPEPPVLIEAPKIAGSGTIGEVLALDPGRWDGLPAPALAFAWLRDDVPIPGAAGRTYLPVAADDGRQLRARVTAANEAGELAAETGPVEVRRAAPRVLAAIPAQSAAVGAGGGTIQVPAAPYFAGDALSFTATGGGSAADAETGVVSIPTGAPLDTVVSVRAANTGGSALAAFRATIAAPTTPAQPTEPHWFAQFVPQGALAAAISANELWSLGATETGPGGVTPGSGSIGHARNLVGAGHHAVQAVPGARPRHVPIGSTGRYAFRTDGQDDILNMAGLPVAVVRTVVLVGRMLVGAPAATPMAGWNTAANVRLSSEGRLIFWRRRFNGSAIDVSPAGVDQRGLWSTLIIRRYADHWTTFRFNGAGSGASGATGTEIDEGTAVPGFAIGASSPTSNNFGLAEVAFAAVINDHAVSDAHASAIHTLAKAEAGIP